MMYQILNNAAGLIPYIVAFTVAYMWPDLIDR